MNIKRCNHVRYALTNTPIFESFVTRQYGVATLEEVPDDKFPEVVAKVRELKDRLIKDRKEYLKKHQENYNETTGAMSSEFQRLTETTGLSYWYDEEKWD